MDAVTIFSCTQEHDNFACYTEALVNKSSHVLIVTEDNGSFTQVYSLSRGCIYTQRIQRVWDALLMSERFLMFQSNFIALKHWDPVIRQCSFTCQRNQIHSSSTVRTSKLVACTYIIYSHCDTLRAMHAVRNRCLCRKIDDLMRKVDIVNDNKLRKTVAFKRFSCM